VIECSPAKDLGNSPVPVFDDYLQALEMEKAAGRLPAHLPEGLPLESSRGCWWGMKNHCTFCGLNGTGMDFRTKPPERMIEEIRELIDRYDPPYLSFTDNIMPLSYFQTVLPELASWNKKPGIFYEVKANLKYDQLELMARAGLTQIQPGIESLSTNVLKLMRKGISAIQNLALLRDAASLDLYVLWNILYGFPGEEVADYSALPDLFLKIEHFRPPGYCVPIVVDRFSPHHADPVGFGIGSYKPYEGFAALFPPGAPLMDLGYHFIGQHSTAFTSDGTALERLHNGYDAWKASWDRRPPVLAALSMGTGAPVVIADTRSIAKSKMTPITVEQDAALRYFETPRRVSHLDPGIAALVPGLVEHAFVIEHEGFYLSVVTRSVRDHARHSAQSWVPVAA
jgi:ribosomal peptide maturation radical SAM protein 1